MTLTRRLRNHTSRLTAVLAAASLPLAGAAAAPAPAAAAVDAPGVRHDRDAAYVPGELVVRTRNADTDAIEGRRHAIRDGQSVQAAARELERRPGVVSATPNFIARASAWIPNDPGSDGVPGGWQALQWNLMPQTGINAPDAWENLIRAGRPGGRDVVVAVLDTGVAYRNRGSFRRSPDLAARRFVRGYDFVDRDRYPLDHNGHGTHVASTIAQSANNGVGLTGIAYNARIMPIRVLDRRGEGDSFAIASGIRFAARRGARIINLSFEFGTAVTRGQIPGILDALRYARRRGVLVVGAAGNDAAGAVAYPARSTEVFSVGATTENGCQAEYSNSGRGLDIVAPGGGSDAFISDPGCRPLEAPGRNIFQTTLLSGSRTRFGIPSIYYGTSMAAPHVSGVAALVIASRVLGRRPTPQQLERHLQATATDLGAPGPDPRYGAGRLNAAGATAPLRPAAR